MSNDIARRLQWYLPVHPRHAPGNEATDPGPVVTDESDTEMDGSDTEMKDPRPAKSWRPTPEPYVFPHSSADPAKKLKKMRRPYVPNPQRDPRAAETSASRVQLTEASLARVPTYPSLDSRRATGAVLITPTDRLLMLPSRAPLYDEETPHRETLDRNFVTGAKQHPLFNLEGTDKDIKDSHATTRALFSHCHLPYATAGTLRDVLRDELDKERFGSRLIMGYRPRPALSREMWSMLDDTKHTVGVGRGHDGSIQVFNNQQYMTKDWFVSPETRQRLQRTHRAEIRGLRDPAEIESCIEESVNSNRGAQYPSEQIVGLSSDECAQLTRDFPKLVPRLRPDDYVWRSPEDIDLGPVSAGKRKAEPIAKGSRNRRPQKPFSPIATSGTHTLQPLPSTLTPGTVGLGEKPLVDMLLSLDGRSRADRWFNESMSTEEAAKANPYVLFTANPGTAFAGGEEAINRLNKFCCQDHTIEEFRDELKRVVSSSQGRAGATFKNIPFPVPTSAAVESILSETPTLALSANANAWGDPVSLFVNPAAFVALESNECGSLRSDLDPSFQALKRHKRGNETDIINSMVSKQATDGMTIVSMTDSDQKIMRYHHPQKMREICLDTLDPYY